MEILKGVPGIGFVRLEAKDVVRHKLVMRIIDAYTQAEEQTEKEKMEKEAAKAERKGQRNNSAPY